MEKLIWAGIMLIREIVRVVIGSDDSEDAEAKSEDDEDDQNGEES